MKTLIVPTDFSECAQHAVEVALAIAEKNSDFIINFIHFKSVPPNWTKIHDPNHRLYSDIDKDNRRIHQKLIDLVNYAWKKGVEAKHQVYFGQSLGEFYDYINTLKGDLIIMGSHGASGLREVFVGSCAQGISRNVDTPVLIVKNQFNPNLSTRLLFVSDFKDSTLSHFDKVLAVGKFLKTELELIYVNTPEYFEESSEVKKRMKRFANLSGIGSDQAEIIDTESFEKGLERYCQESGNCIILLENHSRSGFSRMFTESLTERLINHLGVPVLSVHI